MILENIYQKIIAFYDDIKSKDGEKKKKKKEGEERKKEGENLLKYFHFSSNLFLSSFLLHQISSILFLSSFFFLFIFSRIIFSFLSSAPSFFLYSCSNNNCFTFTHFLQQQYLFTLSSSCQFLSTLFLFSRKKRKREKGRERRERENSNKCA